MAKFPSLLCSHCQVSHVKRKNPVNMTDTFQGGERHLRRSEIIRSGINIGVHDASEPSDRHVNIYGGFWTRIRSGANRHLIKRVPLLAVIVHPVSVAEGCNVARPRVHPPKT